MAPTVKNPRVTFASEVPEGCFPIVGEHLVFDNSRIIDLESVPLNGGFLTQALLLSPEPYMRERMRPLTAQSYSTPMVVGAPVVGTCLVKVLRSEKEGVDVGDLMYGMSHWEAYTVQPYVEGRRKYRPEDWAPGTFDMDSLVLTTVPDPKGAFPLTRYCNILGTPGMSGYVSFEKFAQAKAGETIFVSAGASGVGSMVIQLAKAKGMKVIASAGSDSKVEYMRSLGCDLPFNYKKTHYQEFLSQNGPVNLFYDNVGGEAFAAGLEATAPFSRVIVCGMISEYNVPIDKRFGIQNTELIFKRRLTINGFLLPDLIPEFGAKFFQDVPVMLSEGKLRSQEVVYKGIEKAAQALVDTLTSGSDVSGGKLVVEMQGKTMGSSA
ncbi:NAD(P)-binding protein [Cylindrobasidium torrendii FP15055 ss-10]|uniref:NAD(P)-binding protein n=1 Tax=Cylindrobasidium torrendii FP15055 ss-10 TaxID=1314674 RepID=A0A0D7B861_9AGAR|nr:NAD(P)-binding protein [Cylindrobasidium torrendii FP15055 ss-10]